MTSIKTLPAVLLYQLLFLVSFSQKKESSEFEKCKGKLPFPACTIYGFSDARCDKSQWISPPYFNISFITDSAAEIRAVHSGKVSKIFTVEEGYALVIRSGDYYVTYYPLNNPTLHKGEQVNVGQPVSTVSSATEAPEINILISKSTAFITPYKWFNW